MTFVYVLFHETNTGSAADESDGHVDGVYATEELAERARLEAIGQAIEQGKAVYWNPIEEVENLEWTDDWRVEAHAVVEQG